MPQDTSSAVHSPSTVVNLSFVNNNGAGGELQNLWDKCSSLFCLLVGAWALAQLLPWGTKAGETQQQEESTEGPDEEEEAHAPPGGYLSFTNMVMLVETISKLREWTLKG